MRHLAFWLVLISALLTGRDTHAQWGPPYANSWIRYDQPYVKIGVKKKGLYKIPFSSLPKTFPVNAPEKMQLWRRGKEVAIISTTNSEILFYAVPNDGASDSLLYRPMSSRVNPYSSMYSDESSYFLTIGKNAGKRAKVVEQPADEATPASTYHNELLIKLFQQDYSLSTKTAINPGLINSFFEIGASKTGEVCKKDSQLVINFKLDDYADVAQKPIVKLLLHGRSNNSRKIEVHIGKNKNALRLAKVVDNYGFAATECRFEMAPEDLDAQKNGTLILKSLSNESLERFSIAYYTIEYPQVINIGSQPSKELRLGATPGKWSRIAVKGLPATFAFVEISETDNPVLLKRAGGSLMVPRQSGNAQVVLVTSEASTVAAPAIREVQFEQHSPQDGNYIIITTDLLRPGAAEYAAYRASPAGGALKPVIAEIQDIYNQFNYGEPSPVAIKKFMAYMLSSGVKDKYLLLIGKSITINEKMVRELPGEVPTIGYPGSDMLLVEGLAGAPVNLPAIPVGRLSAVANQTITDYLKKVKAYEQAQAQDQSWRKKVLHISGGKSTSEIIELRDYLRDLEPTVVKGIMGGTVKSYVKQTPSNEVVSVNITEDVNAGVGLISFLGHGSTMVTDPDIGYAREAARDYHNLNKYPIVYFNGCGVGNVFTNRFNANPSNPKSSDRITLSLDWLVAADRGAIAVIANSYESYVGPGVTYLQSLYHYMFDDAESVGLPLGKIQFKVAYDILSKFQDRHNIAYVQQSLLQGDPALRGMNFDKPDYAVEADEGITLSAGTAGKTIGESDSMRISLPVSNLGRFVEGQSVPVVVSWTDKKGTQSKQLKINAFSSQKDLEVSIYNSKSIKSIKISIDPDQTIKELRRDNNVSEVFVDWDAIKDKTSFSNKKLKDNVPPVLSVKIDDRLPKRDEVVWPKPKISIALSDDRQLSSDTTLIDLFIKSCQTDECEFVRVKFENHIQLKLTDSRELQLFYPSNLEPGKYEMLINAKDRSGNAIVVPYRIRFEIGKPEEMQHQLVVSPNPATSFIRFELKNSRLLPLKSVQYLIYDQRGVVLEKKTVPVSETSPTTEWYWFRGSTGAGLYHYKLALMEASGEVIETRSGKVVLAE